MDQLRSILVAWCLLGAGLSVALAAPDVSDATSALQIAQEKEAEDRSQDQYSVMSPQGTGAQDA